MLTSFTLGTLFGIKIRVHSMFLVMPVLLMLADLSLGWFLMLCVIVLLHELGHSLVAQRFGIRVLDITFWPLGGMARMSHIPEDSKIEGLIAIAGPAVNFALAAPAVLIAMGLGIPPEPGFLWQFIGINVALGTFNMIPAFPMDGGRVLRAFLGRKGDWLGATEKAVHVGRMIAVLMGIVGVFTGMWIVPLISVWLWFAGGQELRAVRMRHQQNPLGNLGDFLRQAFGQAANGVPFGAPPQPPPSSTNGAPPRYAPQQEAQRPTSQQTRSPHAGHPAPRAAPGISDADVQRLERFRGPLRHFDDED